MTDRKRRFAEPELESIPTQSHASHILQRADNRLAHASSGFVVAGFCVVFLVAWAVVGFADHWAMVFEVAAAVVTLTMVFVLHHNQRRSLSALQVKIDELVRSSPDADDRYVRAQVADDEELYALEREHVEHYEAVRRPPTNGA
jgi:low affinity Fe/Cu permease